MFRRLLPLLFVGSLVSCGGSNPTTPTPLNIPFSTTDLIVGTGTTVASGMAVQFTYVGYLYSTTAADHKGTQFATSSVSGPLVAQLGQNPPQLIAGLEQGLIGMKVGGRRQIVVPPEMGYGTTGAPQAGIPGNATLLFIIDLEQAATVTSSRVPTSSGLPPPR